MGPETKFRLTSEEVDVFTRNLDYRHYPGAARIALRRTALLTAELESTIRQRRSERTFASSTVSLEALTKILELGCGVTRHQEIPGRAAPSPGGLYAVETYPILFDVDGLTPGIYHYYALDHSLEFVRPLAGVDVMQPFLPTDLFRALPPVVLAFSVVFSRVQTKYLERGYRFALLEAGHIAQNMLLAATALGMNSVPVGGFWDEQFNNLMEFDSATEAIVYSILLGNSDGGAA
jgi:SagB-type dehydrogenase family enzyme